MQFDTLKRFGMLAAAALASLKLASATFAAQTIYFTNADNGAPASLPQLKDTGSGANTGTFSAGGGANSVLLVNGGSQVYMPGYVNGINSSGNGDTSDYLQITGFNPASDLVFVALKVDINGLPISPSDTATLISDINSDNNSVFGANIASTVTPAFSGVFPGYNILLSLPDSFTSAVTPGSGSNGQFDFGFNFSSYGGDFEEPVSVTDIGVVPEPGCLGLLSAGGLLLLPRHRRQRV